MGPEWHMPLDTGGTLVSEKVSLEFEICGIEHTDAAFEKRA